MMIEVAVKRLKSVRCQFRKGTNLNVEGKKSESDYCVKKLKRCEVVLEWEVGAMKVQRAWPIKEGVGTQLPQHCSQLLQM